MPVYNCNKFLIFKTFFLVAASQAPALIDRLLIVKFLNALYIYFFECIIYKWQLNQIIFYIRILKVELTNRTIMFHDNVMFVQEPSKN